jgi:hypothetical protein
MKVKELIKELEMFEPEAEFYVSSDEELNTLYEKFEIATLDDNKTGEEDKKVVIYGLSGYEVDLEY